MDMKHVIIGTAGHIDHGKSALVEALTGTHPDRLEEEKRRGITIDLGFAFLELGDVRFGFVDVPGHERFVKNMLAGAGGIDLVLLVIAADESVKPQTREHFDICCLLGVARGIVVLTKADLVESEALSLARLEVEELVRGSFLEGAPVLAASAKTGAGIAELKEELKRQAQFVPARDASSYARLPIDRAFTMKGFGTVVTGTLVSGAVNRDDELELFPVRRRVRARGIHSGGHAVERAVAGQRTAINLAGMELGELERSMSLATPGIFEPTTRLDAHLTLLPLARALKSRTRVHFYQGTAERVTEVALLESELLAPGESQLAQLRLDKPVLALPGDRFIVRQLSPVVTIGGGIVLDPLAPRHKKGDAAVLPFLRTIERGNREETLGALVDVSPRGLSLSQLIARTGWTREQARAAMESLRASGRIRVVENEPLTLASTQAVADVSRETLQELERFHRANPLVPGISREELRGRAAADCPSLFRVALEDLIAQKKVIAAGEAVRLAGREISLQPEEAKAKEQIEREFERAGLAVPRFADVLAKLPVEPARAQRLLQLLLREKTLIKVTEELIFHRAAVAHLRAVLREYKASRGERLPIAAFKDLTGVSRKYAIPLLEFLDREGMTRRAGDERVIL